MGGNSSGRLVLCRVESHRERSKARSPAALILCHRSAAGHRVRQPCSTGALSRPVGLGGVPGFPRLLLVVSGQYLTEGTGWLAGAGWLVVPSVDQQNSSPMNWDMQACGMHFPPGWDAPPFSTHPPHRPGPWDTDRHPGKKSRGSQRTSGWGASSDWETRCQAICTSC